MPGTLNGKVALVTGGASGIGRATALTFAREGAKLVIADMNEEGGHQTVHMITENGGEAIFVRTDVSNATAVEAMISKAVETYGRLDCAHNNAGIQAHDPCAHRRIPGREVASGHRDQPEGVWFCMKYEILQMLKQGGGTIVNTASWQGWWVPGRAQQPMMASKHGVVGLTKTAALEYAQAGYSGQCRLPRRISTRR